MEMKLLLLILAAALGAVGTARAAGPIVDPYLPAVADPNVPRPTGSTPCVVTLVSGATLQESNDGTQAFGYTPPPACNGPWAKVVLEADYHFDELARSDPALVGVWIGGVNFFFGGTPLNETIPSRWHVERDVTDYAAVLRAPHGGRIRLDPSIFDPFQYNPVLRASVRLLIYPATPTARPPRKPDAVIALGASAAGDTTTLSISQGHPSFPPSQLTRTTTLPRNIERAYLDLFAVGKENDWAWWSCLPVHVYDDHPTLVRFYPSLGGGVGGCLRGTFREAEVRIDGQIAGIAPIYPWIPPPALEPFSMYPTPGLFMPTPPIRSFNLIPFRVDLSPFAGVLSNGAPHTISVSVRSGEPASAIDLISAGQLVLFRDPRTTTISGAVTRNTLATAAPAPTIIEALSPDVGGHVTGTITTNKRRDFLIEGFIDTARGRIVHRVVQTTLFNDAQVFDVTRNATLRSYRQDVDLISKVWRNSYSTLGTATLLHDFTYHSTPLRVSDFTAFPVADPSDQDVNRTIHLGLRVQGHHERPGIAPYSTGLASDYDSSAESFVDSGGFDSFRWRARQTWLYSDNRGSCYSDKLTAEDWAVTDYQSGVGCPGGVDNVRWIAHPDGSPDSLGWAGY